MTPPVTPPQPAASREASGHAARVQQVVDDCFRRRLQGETLSDEQVLGANDDLRPELEVALRHLQLVQAAYQMSGGKGDRSNLCAAPSGPSRQIGPVPYSTNSSLTIRCPHCQTPTPLGDDASFSGITCSTCGNHFSLIDEAAEELPLSGACGHFQILQHLGSGGFGSVYQAHGTQLDRVVALKIPRRQSLTPTEVEQFLREVPTAAQLRHPHIVSVHEVGRDGNTIFIVSDFIDGQSLAERLARQRPTAREAALLCQTLAVALHHAHELGIVHRDLKPGNVLLDQTGQPHITDFGLARRDAGEVTLTLDGVVVGTPAYMSPEQARGDSHQADRRSDLYSLGVILFELLTGELPFRGNVRMVTQQILTADPPAPRKLNPTVPRDLETICLKCLEKDPHRRYASTQELAADLGRFLRGEPTLARPITRTQRAWRWCRRRPVVAGLTAAVAVLLVVVATVTTWSSIRSRESAKAARWQQYLSDMHLAMQAWEEGDVGRAVDVLNRNRPTPGQEDLRRFEWHYLWRQCQTGAPATVLSQDGRVCSVAVSPDDQWLAVCVDISTSAVDVWHLPTKQKLYPLKHPSGWVKSVAFSPDSQSLISGDTGGSVRLWDLTTRSVRHELRGHTNFVRSVAFSPDGMLAATAGGDHIVRLWDTATGAPVHTFDSDNLETVFYQVAFSPDGKLLAAGGDDQTATLWDVATRSLIRSFWGHAGLVRSVAFSPDGNTLATGSNDKTVKLWSVAEGTLLKPFAEHTDVVRSIAFAPDGKRLASASSDGSIRLWDVASDSPPAVLRGHSGRVPTVAFAPGGQTLASGGSDGMVRLWPIENPVDSDVLRGHLATVGPLDISGDGHTIASADILGAVKFWDLRRATLLESRATSSGRAGYDVAYSPSGRYLAVGDDVGNLELWETASSTRVRLMGHEGGIVSLAWSPDEATLAAGDTAGEVILWDVAAATVRLKLPGHQHVICSVAFSPDGQTFVTRCEDGTLRIWDPRTGELRRRIDEPAYWSCPTFFSPDGRILASGSADLSVKFWDTSTWTLLRRLPGHADRVKGLSFSPDGRTHASACDDGQIKLWEVATGEERCTLRGHIGEVEAVRFTPDGQTLVSSSADGTVRIWRTASPAADLPNFPSPSGRGQGEGGGSP